MLIRPTIRIIKPGIAVGPYIVCCRPNKVVPPVARKNISFRNENFCIETFFIFHNIPPGKHETLFAGEYLSLFYLLLGVKY